MQQLTPEDREFFSRIAKVAFANPFGEERLNLERSIAPQNPAWGKRIDQVLKQTTLRLKTFNSNNPVNIIAFEQGDRKILEYVLLFNIFHRYVEEFDKLILDQAAAGEKIVTAEFTRDVFDELVAQGFSEEEAARYLALFYQLRRAFFFINTSITGQSAGMVRLRTELWNNVFTCNIDSYDKFLWNRMEDFSTLLLGPTGCGKGLAGAAIGRSGFIPYDAKRHCFTQSFAAMFVSVNISQFPASLLESELFGHAKGAFTGAMADYDGVFASCQPHGAIFLDEIGELDIQTQIKLLSVLQDRVFTPVGSRKKVRFHSRVIAATNRSLEQLYRGGRFREDFYYRLCTDCIEIPSLAQRLGENPDELRELVSQCLFQITGQNSQELVESVVEKIRRCTGADYNWPGNVRELAQCVRRVLIKGNYNAPTQHCAKDNFIEKITCGQLDAQELMAGYCRMLYQKLGTYEQVAQKTNLDRRTVKKYLESEGHS